jgi:hypothetical protein
MTATDFNTIRVWQKICDDGQICHCWLDLFECIVSDMDIEAVIIAGLLAVALSAAFVVVYQNARKTAHLPHAPFGADVEVGLAEQQRWAESGVVRRSGQMTRKSVTPR